RTSAELGQESEERRVDAARADAVGADVPATVLERHRPCQVDDRRLGGAVGRGEHLAVEALDRRRRDDRSPAAPEERGDRGPHAVEDAVEHDLETRLPDGRVEPADVPTAGRGGVVVDDIEAAPALRGERYRRLEGGEGGDIAVP